jgi:two-component system OmpR family response regulator
VTRVLIADDDTVVRDVVRRYLERDGLDVSVANNGTEALRVLGSQRIDVAVLDVMMPGPDGLALCRSLRQRSDRSVPVILLTALGEEDDRIAGLEAGADDYLAKPFSFAELSARLRALARRGPVERPAILRVGDLHLDPATRRVGRGEVDISLSTKEFVLLATFMRRPGEVLDRLTLLEKAWDAAYDNRSNVIDVYVGYLREKIDRPFGVQSIETVRGAGYRLRPDGGRPSRD